MAGPLKFDKKVVLITGAASGIGRATSLKLAGEGALLALSDINATGLSETLSLCQTAFPPHAEDHFTSVFDVGASDSANAFIAAIMNKYARIDHVFNCAGVNPTKLDTAAITDAYWDKLVTTNLKGIFNITRACIPHLRRGASFVNISSVAGLGPTSGFAVYCATKYGVVGFSKCVVLELG
jgi:NAD(P)-dependent dehydrogenase (short-subunit alcohol dehydrogenase family)